METLTVVGALLFLGDAFNHGELLLVTTLSCIGPAELPTLTICAPGSGPPIEYVKDKVAGVAVNGAFTLKVTSTLCGLAP